MSRQLTAIALQVFLLLLGGLACSLRADIHRGAMLIPCDPLVKSDGAQLVKGQEGFGPETLLVRSLFALYQRGISPTKGVNCPMVPSCSEYARICVARHGLVIGVLMAADHLHRCGHDLYLYPRLWSPARGWCYDDPPR